VGEAVFVEVEGLLEGLLGGEGSVVEARAPAGDVGGGGEVVVSVGGGVRLQGTGKIAVRTGLRLGRRFLVAFYVRLRSL
jgi:hypothetical protein